LESAITDTKESSRKQTEFEEVVCRNLENNKKRRAETEQEEKKLKEEEEEMSKRQKKIKEDLQQLKQTKEEQVLEHAKLFNNIQIAEKRKMDLTVKLELEQEELRGVHQEGIAKLGWKSGHTKFLLDSIKEKEKALECPVCFAEASTPIYGCSEYHLLCSTCRTDPKLASCAICRRKFGPAGPKRNRFAEEKAEELRSLREELGRVNGGW